MKKDAKEKKMAMTITLPSSVRETVKIYAVKKNMTVGDVISDLITKHCKIN